MVSALGMDESPKPSTELATMFATESPEAAT